MFWVLCVHVRGFCVDFPSDWWSSEQPTVTLRSEVLTQSDCTPAWTRRSREALSLLPCVRWSLFNAAEEFLPATATVSSLLHRLGYQMDFAVKAIAFPTIPQSSGRSGGGIGTQWRAASVEPQRSSSDFSFFIFHSSSHFLRRLRSNQTACHRPRHLHHDPGDFYQLSTNNHRNTQPDVRLWSLCPWATSSYNVPLCVDCFCRPLCVVCVSVCMCVYVNVYLCVCVCVCFCECVPVCACVFDFFLIDCLLSDRQTTPETMLCPWGHVDEMVLWLLIHWVY